MVTMQKLITMLICGSILLLCGCATPRRIKTSSIGYDCLLVGRCGVPLGEIFEIEASFVSDPDRNLPKESRRCWLRVTAVNGKRLKDPMEIGVWAWDDRPKGDVFRLRVKEDAEYEDFVTPNLSETSDWHHEQCLFTGLRIIEQLSPVSPR
jgi:hypothetical protein